MTMCINQSTDSASGANTPDMNRGYCIKKRLSVHFQTRGVQRFHCPDKGYPHFIPHRKHPPSSPPSPPLPSSLTNFLCQEASIPSQFPHAFLESIKNST
ncbi:hypothetical protein CDAR_378671 [Caerostris darwini]|uniref:Uncharacterized protein n=1 Tax=Caerostris darwini TaxID=1538125 RepID=A0AAV4MTS4_9ARAC|nr:hypothetical protein CDAR_378671 [Caerostris darwini]